MCANNSKFLDESVKKWFAIKSPALGIKSTLNSGKKLDKCGSKLQIQPTQRAEESWESQVTVRLQPLKPNAYCSHPTNYQFCTIPHTDHKQNTSKWSMTYMCIYIYMYFLIYLSIYLLNLFIYLFFTAVNTTCNIYIYILTHIQIYVYNLHIHIYI